ncbi:MAG: DUF2017 family protein [Mycetocola sp.]
MTGLPAEFRADDTADGRGYLITLAPREGEVLVSLATDSGALLAANPEFAALLVPEAYPDDPEASDEFARYTSTDLGLARIAELELLAAAPAEGGEFRVSEENVAAVLRGIGFLRLLLSDSSGGADEGDEDSEHSETGSDDSTEVRQAVSQWLGWLQETLITALDE